VLDTYHHDSDIGKNWQSTSPETKPNKTQKINIIVLHTAQKELNLSCQYLKLFNQ